MRRLFPAAALLLALAACGSREVSLTGYGLGAAPTGPAPQAVMATDLAPSPILGAAVPADLRAQVVPGSRKKAGSKNGGPVDYGKMGAADFNTMPLTVTLGADCATPGQVMSATAETLPGSKLAFAAAYSDNDFVPSFAYYPGETNVTGTVTWTWEITPNTPRGDAVVTVVAAKEKKGASYKAPFRVADAC
jgi:hypothetical protein